MFTLRPRVLPGLLALTAFCAALGCSKGVKKITVTGKVTYQGQLVRSGIVKFVGPEGAYSAGAVQADGTYIVTDVVPGETKVGIMEAPSGSGSSSGDRSEKPAATKGSAAPLPEKYREPTTSGLVYDITPQTTELEIQIK